MSTNKSIADVIKEIQHWLRLSTFLHCPLNQALLHLLHNKSNNPGYTGLPHAPVHLHKYLSTQHASTIIQNLYTQRILNTDQIKLLFPPKQQKTYSEKFDLTLIVILIRNFLNIPPPLNTWYDKYPPANDKSIAANVIRAREWRNYLHHTKPDTIDVNTFHRKWAEGCQIVADLGFVYNTKVLKAATLDPKNEVVLTLLNNYVSTWQKQDTVHSNNILKTQNDVATLRQDMHKDAVALRQDMRKNVADLRNDMNKDVATIRKETNKINEEATILRQDTQRDVETLRQDTQNDLTALQQNTNNNIIALQHQSISNQENLTTLQQGLTNTNNTLQQTATTLQQKSISNQKELLTLQKEVTELQQQLSEKDNFQSQLKKQMDSLNVACALRKPIKLTEKESTNMCLDEVIEFITVNIGEQRKDLLSLLKIDSIAEEDVIVHQLKMIPWQVLKINLELVGRCDMVKQIQKETLITKGLKTASLKLRNHYIEELIDWLIEQPIRSEEAPTLGSHYVSREKNYIELAVLEASNVDMELSNSDRESLMEQRHLKLNSIDFDDILHDNDEMVFIRGVAGIGKSTLINMYTLKWAKGELDKKINIDFVFAFKCCEINTYEGIESVEQMLTKNYPEVFDSITMDDLHALGSRVLMVVDGLDELQGIYEMEQIFGGKQSGAQKHQQLVYKLVNSKSSAICKNHKSIVCGRPKACEHLNSLVKRDHKTKVIEVCGFNERSVHKYIKTFFKSNKDGKQQLILNAISGSDNLKVMASVPVFLSVICNAYSEELLTEQLHSHTELYLYTCLVLVRNHLQGTTNRTYKTLSDLVQDHSVMQLLYSLMSLSVKTYMCNQVLFTERDVADLKCSVHLEQTGFIVKYTCGDMKGSVYQFKHLVMQEFFCGMHICITKQLKPFAGNRELNSCIPTILGIARLLEDKSNKLFNEFFKNLSKFYEGTESFYESFRSSSRETAFKKFLRKYLEIPNELVKAGILVISSSARCSEFLDFAYESKHVFDFTSIKAIEIQELYSSVNIRNAAYLLEISSLPIVETPILMFQNGGERILKSIAKQREQSFETVIKLKRHVHAFRFEFKEGCLYLTMSESDCHKYSEILRELFEASSRASVIMCACGPQKVGDETRSHVNILMIKLANFAIEFDKELTIVQDRDYLTRYPETAFNVWKVFVDIGLDASNKIKAIYK